jgi:hypothetical protein
MLRCMSHSNSNSSDPRSAANGIIRIRTVATAARTVAAAARTVAATRTIATNGALVKRVRANPGDAIADVHSGSEEGVVKRVPNRGAVAAAAGGQLATINTSSPASLEQLSSIRMTSPVPNDKNLSANDRTAINSDQVTLTRNSNNSCATVSHE